jgi:hypothetical protein
MKKRKLKCFEFDKHKKDYEKWLKDFVDEPSEEELNKMEEETFENFFPVAVSKIIKCNNVNSVNYKPFLEGA